MVGVARVYRHIWATQQNLIYGNGRTDTQYHRRSRSRAEKVDSQDQDEITFFVFGAGELLPLPVCIVAVVGHLFHSFLF